MKQRAMMLAAVQTVTKADPVWATLRDKVARVRITGSERNSLGGVLVGD